MILGSVPVCSTVIQLSVPEETHANMKARVNRPVTIIISSNLPAILHCNEEKYKNSVRIACFATFTSPVSLGYVVFLVLPRLILDIHVCLRRIYAEASRRQKDMPVN